MEFNLSAREVNRSLILKLSKNRVNRKKGYRQIEKGAIIIKD